MRSNVRKGLFYHSNISAVSKASLKRPKVDGKERGLAFSNTTVSHLELKLIFFVVAVVVVLRKGSRRVGAGRGV